MARTSDSSKSVNATRARKRVEADTTTTTASTTLKRAKNGSAFTRCDACNKDVAVALISMHDCGFEAKIKMNLDTIAVEAPTEPAPKKPAAEKKKAAKAKEPTVKKAKKERDPSKPKRPPTAFFLFMDDFRKEFKEAHPDNKNISLVAKEGGEKWKSMTDEEKKCYTDKAAELKEEYQKALENPNEAAKETDKEGEANDDEDTPEKEEVVADEDDATPEKEDVPADDE